MITEVSIDRWAELLIPRKYIFFFFGCMAVCMATGFVIGKVTSKENLVASPPSASESFDPRPGVSGTMEWDGGQTHAMKHDPENCPFPGCVRAMSEHGR